MADSRSVLADCLLTSTTGKTYIVAINAVRDAVGVPAPRPIANPQTCYFVLEALLRAGKSKRFLRLGQSHDADG